MSLRVLGDRPCEVLGRRSGVDDDRVVWLDAVTVYQAVVPTVDLVTLDITMPRLEGVGALERILALDRLSNVIIVSAIGEPSVVKKAMMLGAKNYVVKPFDRAKVLERVIQALR